MTQAFVTESITDQNAEIVNKFISHFNSKNISEMVNLCDDDILFLEPGDPSIPWAGTMKGKREFEIYLTIVFKSILFNKIKINQTIAKENVVVITFIAKGTTIEKAAALSIKVAAIFTVRNKKISKIDVYPANLDTYKALYFK